MATYQLERPHTEIGPETTRTLLLSTLMAADLGVSLRARRFSWGWVVLAGLLSCGLWRLL